MGEREGSSGHIRGEWEWELTKVLGNCIFGRKDLNQVLGERKGPLGHIRSEGFLRLGEGS
jgi:hypothetical protein